MKTTDYFLRRCFSFLCLFAVLCTIVPAHGEVPVEAFARLPLVRQVAISPDGKFLAATIESGGQYKLFVFQIIGEELMITCGLEVREEEWIDLKGWASPTRLLVSIRWEDKRYGSSYTQARLIAMDYDGSKKEKMVKQDIAYEEEIIQVQDRVIDYLPHDPDHVLMEYNKDDPSRPRVYRVNVNTGKGQPIKGGREGILRWMTDRTGEVRIGRGGKKTESSWQFIVCDPGGENWRTLGSFDFTSTTGFRPRGFSKDPNILYVASNHEGGPLALYEYNIRENRYVRKIFGHPEVDVEKIVWDKKTWTPRCVEYSYNGLQRHWLDPEAEAELGKVEKIFPGLTVTVVDSSEDESIWLGHAGSETNPGGYFIVNRRDKKIARIHANYPELADVKLSPMHSFEYEARDGLEIHAYLSLPPAIEDMEKAPRLPLVVMPHGGPGARDYAEFDPFVQLMTSRGYAVLEIYFRGSSGYGKDFETAGHKEWGKKMQDDITDGVQYVIDKDIADPDRIGIFGISYGGYAALMGAVKTPNLYRCAIGLNGVYDLKEFVKRTAWYVGPVGQYWRAVIGDPSDARISPAKQAKEFKIPVLIAGSKDDTTVPFDQAKLMAKALKKEGIDHEFLKFDTGGHGLWLNKDSRLAFMQALLRFLGKNMK